MPTRGPSIRVRIRQSEDRIKALIEQRNKELLAIINECYAVTIDDSWLVGFLLFARNPDNKDHPILKEFKELAKASKILGKKQRNNQQSKNKKAKA